MVLEKTLESPLDSKKIQPVHPKGDQSWVFFGRTDVELKLQYFGHLMRRVDSLEKALMLGGIGGRRRTGQQRMRWQSSVWMALEESHELTGILIGSYSISHTANAFYLVCSVTKEE